MTLIGIAGIAVIARHRRHRAWSANQEKPYRWFTRI